jgi:erythromycin esterase
MKVGRRGSRLVAAWAAGVMALSAAAVSGVSRADTRAHAGERAFLAWAGSAAIPLRGAESPGEDTDLVPLARAIGSARVVALGEPGHGAQEPLALRNRLFEYLVQHDGITAIALETSFTESRALEQFVLGGSGDAATLVKRNLSWNFGGYEANVELIRWMREYNKQARGRRKVHFYGIDMSGGGNDADYDDPGIAVRSVVEYLRTATPKLSLDVLHRIAPQLLLMNREGYRQMALHDPGALGKMLESLRAHLAANEPVLQRASSRTDYDWAAHNLVVAGQLFDYLRLQTAPEGKSTNIDPMGYREDNVREAAMAANMLWALNEEGPGGRLVVYAHDAHVMNDSSQGGIWSVYKEAPVMMGARLRARLGARLVIIGILGAHNGRGLPLDRPLPGSVEATLENLHRPLFALDLRSTRGNDGAVAWLDQRRPIRANFDTETDVVPLRAFDVVVFMNEITRAIPNGAPN